MNPKRILVSDPISEKGVAVINSHPDLSADFKTGLSPEELISIIGDYDGLIVRSQTKVTPEVLSAAKKLKVIGRAGVGVDNIDRESATDHGVIVMNTPTGNTISTAELAFTLMLSTARNIPHGHNGVISGDFPAARKNFKGIELNEKRLAIIGMGRIGAEFAKRAQAFNMKIIAYDPFLTEVRAQQLNVELAETPEAALTNADVVTLHVPLNKETKHILNADRLSLMNKGAIVINCARGGLIDENALKTAIESGHISGCGLDVYEEEPPAAEHPLFSFKKHTTFTPHLGASTNEAQENVGILVSEQVRDFLASGEIRNAINMPSLDASVIAEIGHYLNLAKSLGKFIAKLGPTNPDSLRVSYHGDIALKDTALISRNVLTGYLETARADGQVNIVNAAAVAKEMGLNLIQSTINAKTEFSELIVVKISKGNKTFRLAGTIIGKSARIVEIDELFVDTNITGNFLIVKNDDSPGIVGHVGTVLGQHKLNIANLSLARNKSEGNALNVIELDTTPSKEVIHAIASYHGVISVNHIEI